jgi:hypothetical protein
MISMSPHVSSALLWRRHHFVPGWLPLLAIRQLDVAARRQHDTTSVRSLLWDWDEAAFYAGSRLSRALPFFETVRSRVDESRPVRLCTDGYTKLHVRGRSVRNTAVSDSLWCAFARIPTILPRVPISLRFVSGLTLSRAA